METLQVALGRRSYPIYIGGGLLEQAEELLRPLGVGRWAIVCDDTVAALYGAPLARRTGWPLVTFPAGEGPSRWRSTTACAAGWCSWA